MESPANALKLTTPSDREITLTRVFAAPRSRVFAALTQPSEVERWLLGPPGWSMIVCQIDPQVGGRYRYLWRHENDGTEMGMGGVYQEISPPERTVHTEAFDQAWYPGEAIVTTVLAEADGKTTLSATIRYGSPEARDTVLSSGMEHGVAASYDRLAQLLA